MPYAALVMGNSYCLTCEHGYHTLLVSHNVTGHHQMPFFELKFETSVSMGGYQMDGDTGLVSEKVPGALQERRWMNSQDIFLAAQEWQQILGQDEVAKYDFLTINAVETFHSKYGPLSGPWIEGEPRACNFFNLSNAMLELTERPLVSGLKMPIVEVPNSKGDFIPSLVPTLLWEAIVLAYKFPDAEMRTCNYVLKYGGPRKRRQGLCPPNCLIPRNKIWGEGCLEQDRKIRRGLSTHKEK
jgi:hypothetical protein